jgi:outer membrane protein OmpA-like peptidoglycan-associated protein
MIGLAVALVAGAGIGALTGGAVGGYMDRQEAELRAQLQGTGVSVTRAGDQIILNMPSNITFNTDQDAVKAGVYPTLNSVALVLKKFNRTIVDVYGHTDSTGSDQHNYDLSERRAYSVANYLSSQGVDQRRFAVTGFGKTRPVADNSTEAGRALNRRVELLVTPQNTMVALLSKYNMPAPAPVRLVAAQDVKPVVAPVIPAPAAKKAAVPAAKKAPAKKVAKAPAKKTPAKAPAKKTAPAKAAAVDKKVVAADAAKK